MITRLASAFTCSAALGLAAGVAQAQGPPKDGPKESDRRPKIVMRSQPSIGTSPARVVLTAELVGGADDFEEYYCASVEWVWGDDTASESSSDCPPYEAGKSAIKRRFVVEHVFRRAGNYRIMFHLKQRSRLVATGMTNVQIRPGPRDF